jgi:hypothetical protein
MNGPSCCVASQLQHCLLTPTHFADLPDGLGCILQVLFQSKQEGSDIIQGSFPILGWKLKRFDRDAMAFQRARAS